MRKPPVAGDRRLGRHHRVLVVLVAAIGGELRDEFEIPGSDTQRATDLIEEEFASEQGGVLNLVFAAPAGEVLDTPERRAAIEEAIARLQSPEFAPAGTRPDSRASGIRSARTQSPTTTGSPTRRPSSIGSFTTRIGRRFSRSRTRFAKPSSQPA